MGISGLLPLLKPIQVNKHLSEYSGQTIAVDAYVWLHRGTYACATDLATGKKTTKYVDYCLHRVRLLRHYNITPYIVFDGGPLPAKKGTESDRKKKREENLARANALAAQGKYTQAREFYVKCVDVTPQMAYQLIKALRVESVAYVVAPYEADAQMAYLERVGLVDGILTEDSDLLVFGCKNVLLKLDAVESTVISISRADFASLAASGNSGVSLHGCIPSVGLKTAWSLLRKHNTAENVIRALQIEGKKNVPKGYLQAFKLAEKVFLHQRVYDPRKQMLVHVTPIPDGEDWDEDKEAHVGRYIEPSLAKKVAEGDACPVTLQAMEDINPTFVPRALKQIPLNNVSSDTKRKGKEKMAVPEKARSATILTFFTPNAKSQPQRGNACKTANTPTMTTAPRVTRPVVGQSSGKRTLTEAMEHDIASKRQKRKEREVVPGTPTLHVPPSTRSKFFDGSSSSRPKGRHVAHDTSDTESVAGPSSGLAQLRHDKENIPSLPSEDELDEGEISMDEVADPVTQEDGYMSPSPSFSRWDSPELSSPLRPRRGTPSQSIAFPEVEDLEEDEDFDADILSSPPSAGQKRGGARHRPRTVSPSGGNVLVRGTPTPSEKRGGRAASPEQLGPDLRDIFENWSDGTSDIDESYADTMESVASSSEPLTPESLGRRVVCVDDGCFDEMTTDIEGGETESSATTRNDRIANGWWERWACAEAILTNKQSKIGTLRRRETTVTPEGRHHPERSSAKTTLQNQDLRMTKRKSLPFLSQTKAIEKTRPAPRNDVNNAARAGSSDSEQAEGSVLDAKNRLAEFRYVAA